MLLVLIRTIIMYFAVLFTVRIMGKGELSNSSPFQMVIIFMIAELASIPIDSPDIPIITGLTAIASLLILQLLISYISLKSEKFKCFINGKPSILISGGNINERALISQRITINELTEQLRIAGAPSITDVDYAVMESNGSLSVILKPEKRPLTPEDLNIRKEKSIMPLVIVADGNIYESNLTEAGLAFDDLESTLHTLGIPDVKDVFMAVYGDDKNLHIYMRDKNHIIKEVSFSS